MRKVFDFILLALLFFPLVQGCKLNNSSAEYGYLNYYYSFMEAADIYRQNVYSKNWFNEYDKYTSYTSYFDKNKSYLDFQCYGTSVDDFYCLGTIKLVDMKGNVLLDRQNFSCWTNAGLYYGMILYNDPNDKELIGSIYVHTPYWCKLQLDCDVDGTGEIKQITFAFWKTKANPLPDFLVNYE